MSQQTILHPTIDSLKEEAEKTFIKNADKYLLKRRFALGDDYCSFEQADAAMIFDIIELNNCNILTLIKKELESIEDLEDEKKKCSEEVKLTANENLYELWLSRGNCGSMEDFLDSIL